MTLQVGVKAVVRNAAGRLLVLRRSAKYETAEGSWDIPGGRIDPGSSLRVNLDRELQEETGLALTSEPRLLAAQDIFFTNAAGEEKHIVRLTYLGTAEGEPTIDPTEHTEYLWVTFEELSTLDGLDGYLKELIFSGVLTEDSWTRLS